MEPTSGRFLLSEENREATPKQFSYAHSEREAQHKPESDDAQRQDITRTGTGEERRSSGERIKFLQDRKGSLISSPVDTTPVVATHGSVGGPKKRGSILRKSGQRFKAVDDASVDPSNFSTAPTAGGGPVMSRKESSGSVFSCQDRRSSRKMKRKPSLMSITISQCSDAGPGRQFTLFQESPVQSPKLRKRDSVVSTGSVKAAILKPSIMAEGEMFSECHRRKQWLMAIHASHPDEALPLLKKPVLFVDEGGRVTKEALSSWVRENLLLVMTILGVVLGVAVGILARSYTYTADVVMLVSFPGEIMMRMLKMLILPLIISSIITGLSCLDTGSSGKMGSRALCYYFSTTILAAMLGITMVTSIHPGDPSILVGGSAPPAKTAEDPQVLDALLDIVRNMFPDNLVMASFSSTKTIYKKVKPSTLRLNDSLTDSSNDTLRGNETAQNVTDKYERSLTSSEGTNVMGMIVFCVAFGSLIGRMPQGKLMVDFFIILNDVVMKMVELIMWYSPFGIMSLVIGQIMSIEDLRETAQMLGLYMLTVIAGLFVHAVITLPTIFFLVTRRNPALFFKGMIQAWITALGTGSSSATLPITFRCLEENNKVDKRVTRFVLPVGATINMDGTALYEAVGSIFIAQMYGIHLGPGELITVSLTATLASIGAASIPSAGLVTMLLVLTAIGLPTEHVSLIFAVDWILDRVRTSINVLGDAFGAGIVMHLCKEELERMGPAQPSIEMLDRAESGMIPIQSPAPASPQPTALTPTLVTPKDVVALTEKGNGQLPWGGNPEKSPNSETQI